MRRCLPAPTFCQHLSMSHACLLFEGRCIRIPKQIITLICVIFDLLCISEDIVQETLKTHNYCPRPTTYEESINCRDYGNLEYKFIYAPK
jgi:hypothetical protein